MSVGVQDHWCVYETLSAPSLAWVHYEPGVRKKRPLCSNSVLYGGGDSCVGLGGQYAFLSLN